MSILQIHEVTKVYEGKVTKRALNQLSFEVEKGEFVAIMGPSGSGKTTLMNVVSMIDVPTSGDVIFDGMKPQKFTSEELAYFRRRQLGFVFQEFNLLPTLTVEENIILPLTLDEQPIAVMEERLAYLSDKLDLMQILDKRPDEISGGQAQRTAIARALIHEPMLVLADEPTGNLDSNASREVLELLVKMNKENKTTILMVTHDPIAASYCDRVIFIKDGEFFNEIYTDDRRQTFFQRILNVLSLLGGHVGDFSSIRLP